MAEEVVQNAEPAPQGGEGMQPEAPLSDDVGLGAGIDPAPAEQQSAPEPDAEAGAPEEYSDFVDDKGFAFAAKDMPEFTSMAKELGLSQDKAQKLLLTMVPTVKGKIANSLNALKTQWKSASLNDEEYGGSAFKANMQIANKAYAEYVTPELKQFMQQSGLSAHPDFIRMFYRIGKSMSQDTGVTGQGAPQPKRRMFPNSNMAV